MNFCIGVNLTCGVGSWCYGVGASLNVFRLAILNFGSWRDASDLVKPALSCQPLPSLLLYILIASAIDLALLIQKL